MMDSFRNLEEHGTLPHLYRAPFLQIHCSTFDRKPFNDFSSTTLGRVKRHVQ
jgi:hypothetical protein